jgi:hypothetical protein
MAWPEKKRKRLIEGIYWIKELHVTVVREKKERDSERKREWRRKKERWKGRKIKGMERKNK